MNTVFLNGTFMPLEEARISPLDRGFLFGEGLYEVLPCYGNRMIAWQWHKERLTQGLQALDIKLQYDWQQLQDFCQQLTQYNPEPDQGIYIHITRGAEEKRFHGWHNNAEPTIFMMTFPIPTLTEPDFDQCKPLRLGLEQDLRWRNCHIKSTSLLGNVLHFQSAQQEGLNEVLLLGDDGTITEASTSNVFICKDNEVHTPPLSSALLPGITRRIIMDILDRHSALTLQESVITQDMLFTADEVWLTSSTKGVVPVVEVAGKTIADGKPGKHWLDTARLYFQHRFDY
ncbi:aminotransferase class IV [Planctobacterium marinum]|uniref:aminotransferase class IV n=1 Tax=Planctobacterium marinum TaxID=1631968 RepID=UPI0030C6F8C3